MPIKKLEVDAAENHGWLECGTWCFWWRLTEIGPPN